MYVCVYVYVYVSVYVYAYAALVLTRVGIHVEKAAIAAILDHGVHHVRGVVLVDSDFMPKNILQDPPSTLK